MRGLAKIRELDIRLARTTDRARELQRVAKEAMEDATRAVSPSVDSTAEVRGGQLFKSAKEANQPCGHIVLDGGTVSVRIRYLYIISGSVSSEKGESEDNRYLHDEIESSASHL